TALLSWHKDGNVTAEYGPFVDSSVPVYPHDPGAGEWAQDLVLDRSDARFFATGAIGRLAIFMRCLKCFEHHRSVNAFVQLFLGEVLVEATSVNNDSERLFDLRQSAEAAARALSRRLPRDLEWFPASWRCSTQLSEQMVPSEVWVVPAFVFEGVEEECEFRAPAEQVRETSCVHHFLVTDAHVVQ